MSATQLTERKLYQYSSCSDRFLFRAAIVDVSDSSVRLPCLVLRFTASQNTEAVELSVVSFINGPAFQRKCRDALAADWKDTGYETSEIARRFPGIISLADSALKAGMAPSRNRVLTFLRNMRTDKSDPRRSIREAIALLKEIGI